MKFLASLRTLLAFVFHRSRVEREMEEELRSHLRIRADDLERQGLSRSQAERQARLEFGGYERYKEECRDALGSRLARRIHRRRALRRARPAPESRLYGRGHHHAGTGGGREHSHFQCRRCRAFASLYRIATRAA